VIALQSRLVGRGKASINSSSSTQYFAANLACAGPNKSVTALMKAPNSRSAMTKHHACCDLTIAIKPEKWGGTNWTKVSIDVPLTGRHGTHWQMPRSVWECQTDTKVL
jgi:hypothetical protein